MNKKTKNIILLTTVFVCILFSSNTFLSAEDKKKSQPTGTLTTNELPLRKSLDKEYEFKLYKSFDDLNVIEIYSFDILTAAGNSLTVTDTWSAKQVPNKEFAIGSDYKMIIKSEESEYYQDNICFRFVTVRFYWKHFESQELVAEFTYRKMY
ncbi:hypothetical protein HZA55_09630 [Candidatus Poribacteria bacterium]|nr:hypothetical protein [Candidatus Poribacteria bacterium]